MAKKKKSTSSEGADAPKKEEAKVAKKPGVLNKYRFRAKNGRKAVTIEAPTLREATEIYNNTNPSEDGQ